MNRLVKIFFFEIAKYELEDGFQFFSQKIVLNLKRALNFRRTQQTTTDGNW